MDGNTQSIIMVILRGLHIFAGIFWVGGGLMNIFLVMPTVGKLGPDGGKFMGSMMAEGGGMKWFQATSGTALLTGLLMLYFRSPGAYAWAETGQGIVLMIGVLAGLIAFGNGLYIAKLSEKVGALGAEIQAGGGPPSAEQGAKMGSLQAKMTGSSRIALITFTIAVLGMSSFRWLWF